MSDEQKKNEEGEKNSASLPYVLQLKHPVPLDSNRNLTELVFEREMEAGDLMGIPTEGILFDHMLKMVSRMSAQPMPLVKRLKVDDMMEAMNFVNSFLPGGLATE